MAAQTRLVAFLKAEVAEQKKDFMKIGDDLKKNLTADEDALDALTTADLLAIQDDKSASKAARALSLRLSEVKTSMDRKKATIARKEALIQKIDGFVTHSRGAMMDHLDVEREKFLRGKRGALSAQEAREKALLGLSDEPAPTSGSKRSRDADVVDVPAEEEEEEGGGGGGGASSTAAPSASKRGRGRGRGRGGR